MMLTIKNIKKLFFDLNAELKSKNVIGEVGLCGGAVMCLVFQARESTKDVDAIFEPTKEIRQAAKKVAKKNGLDESWLNDAAKSYFHVDPPRQSVLEFSNLRVWAPHADYMLAMKTVATSFDTKDKTDVIFLIEYLDLKTVEDVLKKIELYYPKKMIPAKAQFLIEEVMEEKKNASH